RLQGRGFTDAGPGDTAVLAVDDRAAGQGGSQGRAEGHGGEQGGKAHAAMVPPNPAGRLFAAAPPRPFSDSLLAPSGPPSADPRRFVNAGGCARPPGCYVGRTPC